jgi:hypothetical protein
MEMAVEIVRAMGVKPSDPERWQFSFEWAITLQVLHGWNYRIGVVKGMILVCWGDMESSRPLWGHISRKLPYLLEVAEL